jgi:hypothetical protein
MYICNAVAGAAYLAALACGADPDALRPLLAKIAQPDERLESLYSLWNYGKPGGKSGSVAEQVRCSGRCV